MSGRWGSGGQALRVRGHMAKRCANGCGFLAAREAGQALRAGTIRHPSTTGVVPKIAFAMKVSHWIFARCAHYSTAISDSQQFERHLRSSKLYSLL